MKKSNVWLHKSLSTITRTKHLLSNASIVVRTSQFNILKRKFKLHKLSKVIDIGVTSDETLKDSNMFEKLYPYKKNLTCATIENVGKLKKLYPKLKVVKVLPKKTLPFTSAKFDIATSWATLEHVGGYKDQEFFINEHLRVGKHIFITTPYRGCFYEPHSGFLFLHWLPLKKFRNICSRFGKKFWSTEENLNPLYIRDIKKMKLIKKVNISVYNTFGIIPSHLLITA